MRLLILLLTLLSGIGLHAQHRTGFINTGLEYDLYPAGHMFMVQAEYALGGQQQDRQLKRQHSLHFKLGVDIARRTGMSPMNDQESGWGPGASIGYRFYFNSAKGNGYDGFYIGAHSDLWQLKIHWKDSTHTPNSGETSTTVIQPSFDIGYKKQLGDWDLILGLNNGIEINVITNGKGVGQGWITSGQLVIARRLY